MSEYRIEKLRHQLSVILSDGQRLDGEVFLRQLSRYRARPEEAVDMLNDSEPFFALVTNGETKLVAKSNVSRAETDAVEGGDELDVGVLGILVEVTMTDGSTCAGNIFLETRSDRPRLLDYLNSYRDRFLPVVDARKIFLVNTQTIAHVREVA